MDNANSDTAVLSRAFDAANGNLAPEAARSILDLRITEEDRQRATELGRLAAESLLSVEQEQELDNLRHAARVLELLKSKARLSLNAQQPHS